MEDAYYRLSPNTLGSTDTDAFLIAVFIAILTLLGAQSLVPFSTLCKTLRQVTAKD
jgi:hypothetical protein